MATMELFQLRIPKKTLVELPEVASNHQMTVPQFVRTLLCLATSGQLELTIKQKSQNGSPAATAD